MNHSSQLNDQVLRQVLEESQQRGFLGPGPVGPHVESAQQFAQALPIGIAQGCTKGEFSLLDMGSGGGLPGLPLLRWFESLRGTLVDARSKRTRFLDEVLATLGIVDRTVVVTGRIEEMTGELGQHHVVTARSFGPPSATVELASHLLRPTGVVLVSEPPGGRLWAAEGLSALGLVQVSADGAPIACFERIGSPGPVRRWKHVVERPAVVVGSAST